MGLLAQRKPPDLQLTLTVMLTARIIKLTFYPWISLTLGQYIKRNDISLFFNPKPL